MVFSTAVVDPVATLHEQKIDLPGFNFSFGAFDDMVQVLERRAQGPRIPAGRSVLAPPTWCWAARCRACSTSRILPEAPALLDYNGRLTAREAFHRAADATWPPHLFPTPA